MQPVNNGLVRHWGNAPQLSAWKAVVHLLTPMPLKVARRRLALPRLLDSESSGSAILREPPGVNWLQGQGSAPCVGRAYEALSGLLQSPCVKNIKWPARLVSRQRLLLFRQALICLSYWWWGDQRVLPPYNLLHKERCCCYIMITIRKVVSAVRISLTASTFARLRSDN